MGYDIILICLMKGCNNRVILNVNMPDSCLYCYNCWRTLLKEGEDK